MTSPRKLNALTALRFFAAALIVVYHANPAFGLGDVPASLDQGVSFFFVLSGFILAYVYPQLNSFKAVARFWWARFARIWPGHAFSFGLILLLLPQDSWTISGAPDWKLAAANLAMVHAWIPYWDYYYSFNSPSWSISTEFFFYLCFPLLIWRWQRSWPLKLLVAFALVTVIVALCETLDLPWADAEFKGVSSSSLFYIHPLGRIFEFVLGMAAALFLGGLGEALAVNALGATALEFGVSGLVLASMAFAEHSAFEVQIWFDDSKHAVAEWLIHSGSSLFFALLIVVFARERGWLSRLLSGPTFVLLGEISFAVYLVHQIVLRRFLVSAQHFAAMPAWLLYGAYWAAVLFSAYLIWRFVELPSRKFLVGLWRSERNYPL